MKAARGRDDSFLQRSLAGKDVMQRDLGIEVEHHIQIGQPKVCIQHQNAQTMACECCSQIG